MQFLSLSLQVKFTKGSRVFRETALNSRKFGSETLDQMPCGHSGRNAVRVNNEIRHNTFRSEWEILLAKCHSANSFLAVSRSKLISDLRDPDASYFYLHEFVAVTIFGDQNLVYYAMLGASGIDRAIFRITLRRLYTLYVKAHCRPHYQHISSFDHISRDNDTVCVYFAIMEESLVFISRFLKANLFLNTFIR